MQIHDKPTRFPPWTTSSRRLFAVRQVLVVAVLFILALMPNAVLSQRPPGDLSLPAQECMKYFNASASFCTPLSAPAYHCQMCTAPFACMSTKSCPTLAASDSKHMFLVDGTPKQSSCMLQRVQTCAGTNRPCVSCDPECQASLLSNGICALNNVTLTPDPTNPVKSSPPLPSQPSSTTQVTQIVPIPVERSTWTLSHMWPLIVCGVLVAVLLLALLAFLIRRRRRASNSKSRKGMGDKGVFINRAYGPRPESMATASQFQLMRDVTNDKPSSPNGSPTMSKGDLVDRLNAAEADASGGSEVSFGGGSTSAVGTSGQHVFTASMAASLRDPPGRANMSNPLACSSRSIDISLDSDDEEAQYSPTRQEMGAYAMPSDIRPLPSSVVGPDSLSPMIASRDLSSAASLAAPPDASTLSSSPVLPELGDTPTPSVGVPEPAISADDAEMLSLAFRESLMGSRASLDGKSLRSMQSGPLRSMDREASASLSRQLSPALEGRLLPPAAPEPTAATEVSLSRQ